MFGKPVHTQQSATSSWRDLWLNTRANLSPSYSPLQQTPRACAVFTQGRWFRPSPKPSQTFSSQWQLLFDCWRRTSNRLGDLQISKIKRLANLNLSLMNCSTQCGLGFSLEIFLGMLTTLVSENIQRSSQPQMAGGCGVFIGGNPNGEMMDVTWCDSLTRVHNGRIFKSMRNFTWETRKLTHQMSSLSEAQSAMTLPSSNSSVQWDFSR